MKKETTEETYYSHYSETTCTHKTRSSSRILSSCYRICKNQSRMRINFIKIWQCIIIFFFFFSSFLRNIKNYFRFGFFLSLVDGFCCCCSAYTHDLVYMLSSVLSSYYWQTPSTIITPNAASVQLPTHPTPTTTYHHTHVQYFFCFCSFLFWL